MAANEAVKEEPELVESAEESDSERDRSTIAFPYSDLDDAVAVAKGVNAVGGSSCDWDQLAAQLNQAARGGSFRLKMISAKLFGFVTYSQGKVLLTPLGVRLCDSKQEKLAKADGFLTVPLYKAIYDKFKGNALPPAKGFETEIVNLGVAKKVTDKARQVFQRSATQAGFFWSGQDRLVMPAKGSTVTEAPDSTEDHSKDNSNKSQRRNNGGSGSEGGDYHPFIAGLLKTLPPADSDWPMDARRKWLQAASTIFEVIYKDSDSKGSLRIEVQKDSAR